MAEDWEQDGPAAMSPAPPPSPPGAPPAPGQAYFHPEGLALLREIARGLLPDEPPPR